MKTTISSMIAALFLVASLNVSAQQSAPSRGESKGYKHGNVQQHEQRADVPKLTEEQRTKISALKVAHRKSTMPLTNQLRELKARQHTLQTAEKVDTKAINANIDEIGKVQVQLMKAGAAHKQEIRALLTEEQRLMFDMRGDKGKGGHNKPGHGPKV